MWADKGPLASVRCTDVLCYITLLSSPIRAVRAGKCPLVCVHHTDVPFDCTVLGSLVRAVWASIGLLARVLAADVRFQVCLPVGGVRALIARVPLPFHRHARRRIISTFFPLARLPRRPHLPNRAPTCSKLPLRLGPRSASCSVVLHIAPRARGTPGLLQTLFCEISPCAGPPQRAKGGPIAPTARVLRLSSAPSAPGEYQE